MTKIPPITIFIICITGLSGMMPGVSSYEVIAPGIYVEGTDGLGELPVYVRPYAVLSSTGRVHLEEESHDKQILRYKKHHDAVSYAWEKWKDFDFILMIQEESLWKEIALGDSGDSVGYCQMNKYYNREQYDAYLGAKDWKERITLCYDFYQANKEKVGEIFYGWNNRERNTKAFSFY